MVTLEKLNDDQRKSFYQMTLSGGVDRQKALELIEELCIQKKHTGLRCTSFRLTPLGKVMVEALSNTN